MLRIWSMRLPAPIVRALKLKKWAHAHSVLHLGLESQIIARGYLSAVRRTEYSRGDFSGPCNQIVVAGADDLDLDKITRSVGRRVAFREENRRIDVQRLRRQTAPEHEIVVGRGALDEDPGSLADTGALPML